MKLWWGLTAERPKHFGKQESLYRRRSYLRDFPAVNCIGVIIVRNVTRKRTEVIIMN